MFESLFCSSMDTVNTQSGSKHSEGAWWLLISCKFAWLMFTNARVFQTNGLKLGCSHSRPQDVRPINHFRVSRHRTRYNQQDWKFTCWKTGCLWTKHSIDLISRWMYIKRSTLNYRKIAVRHNSDTRKLFEETMIPQWAYTIPLTK